VLLVLEAGPDRMRCPAVTNEELTGQDHRLILDLGAIYRFAVYIKDLLGQT